MSIIQSQTREGVLVLTFDTPGQKVNTLSNAALTELEAAFDHLPDGVQGVVIASAKESFLAGADLNEVLAMTSEDEAARTIGWVARIQGKIADAPVPVVVALNGVAMGGGFEIALAAHGRIGTPDLRLGLPEIDLGLMPGAGGTQRLPRLAGLAAGLEVVLFGKVLTAHEALELGVLNQIADASNLIDAACALAKGLTIEQDPKRHPAPNSPEATALFIAAEARLAKRRGDADQADRVILDVMREGYDLPLDQALELEGKAFAKLAVSPTAKNRIRTGFLGPQKLKAMAARPKDQPTTTFTKIAVAGGGLMGSGIAFAAAQNGISVVVLEADEAGAARCQAALERSAARLEKRGKLTPDAAQALLARIKVCSTWPDLSDVQAAIEAVPEVEAIKADVLGRLAAALPRGVLVASNTSTMAISGLARFLPDPSRFIGMHFFSPVEVMPLLEVISGRETSGAALAMALDLAKQLRKVTITVQDGPGFFTSRIVGTYTGEALTLLAEGYDPALIDKAALQFGMPIGPLAMADLVGLPLLSDIYAALAAGGSKVVEGGNRAREVLKTLVEAGRKGRQTGGIFDYPEGAAPKAFEGLAGLFPPSPPEGALELIKRRMFHIQSIEALRAVEEGIITDLTQADVASTLGWSFPKSWGGVISYVDTLGAQRFLKEAQALAQSYGPRFAPPALLEKMAKEDRRFHIR